MLAVLTLLLVTTTQALANAVPEQVHVAATGLHFFLHSNVINARLEEQQHIPVHIIFIYFPRVYAPGISNVNTAKHSWHCSVVLNNPGTPTVVID